MKIYVAGHAGLVGSAIVRKIEKDGIHTWVGRTREQLDLFDLAAVRNFIRDEKPDAVIVAAAKVGGIGANSKFPVEFLNENLRIELNLMEAAHALGVPRLLFLGSSCIYPKFSNQPIKESELLMGPLEPTNEPYAIAKIAGLKMVEAYSREYGHDWVSAMPTNVYGPNDNYDKDTGHVIASLISKFHFAKSMALDEVSLWGSGEALREFIFVDDLADALLFLLQNHHSPEHVNVGTGAEISISELAETIRRKVGFEGKISWDTKMPNGTPRKILDCSKLLGMGWRSQTLLEDGISITYESFLSLEGSRR